MTSQGVLVLDTNKPRQTTVRVPPETLRKARYHLDKEGRSIQEFLAEQLERYVREQEQAPPEAAECA